MIHGFNDSTKEKIAIASDIAFPVMNVNAQSEGYYKIPSEIVNILLSPSTDFIITGLNQNVPGQNYRTDKLCANGKVYPYYTIENNDYYIYVYNPSGSTATMISVHGTIIRTKVTAEG